MGARVRLDSLLETPSTTNPPEQTAPPAPPYAPRAVQTKTPKPKSTAGRADDDHPTGTDDNTPRYLQLERKETRLEIDQLDQLTALVRQLNKRRRSQGERITENTLIRIAVDLLLREAQALTGITETELRKSVGL